MSEAADFIADLDAEIAEAGQGVTLRRPVANGQPVEHGCAAIVRGYRPDELEGGLQQGDSLVILSPTGLPASFADTDATRLRAGDRVVFDGRARSVGFVDPVRVAGTLVRMNLTVRG